MNAVCSTTATMYTRTITNDGVSDEHKVEALYSCMFISSSAHTYALYTLSVLSLSFSVAVAVISLWVVIRVSWYFFGVQECNALVWPNIATPARAPRHNLRARLIVMCLRARIQIVASLLYSMSQVWIYVMSGFLICLELFHYCSSIYDVGAFFHIYEHGSYKGLFLVHTTVSY